MLANYPKTIFSPVAQNGDKNEIPQSAAQDKGELSYDSGFPYITQIPIEAGGVAPDRKDFNGILNEISQHLFFLQNGGRYQWQDSLDYETSAVVLGSNGILYKALQNSGISFGGAKDPTDNLNFEFWQRYEKLDPTGELKQAAQRSSNGGWTLLVEPNNPLYLYLYSPDNINAKAYILTKSGGMYVEKTPILLGVDELIGTRASSFITLIPKEEVLILEVFEISENTTIYAYQ